MTSGVPQGSVLGPLLFLIMMTDIDLNTNGVNVGCYADDTRILRGISNTSDQAALQQQLNIVYGWARENRMFFL